MNVVSFDSQRFSYESQVVRIAGLHNSPQDLISVGKFGLHQVYSQFTTLQVFICLAFMDSAAASGPSASRNLGL